MIDSWIAVITSLGVNVYGEIEYLLSSFKFVATFVIFSTFLFSIASAFRH
jgi:amino acid permease